MVVKGISNNYILLASSSGLEKIELAQIVHIEAAGNYVVVILNDSRQKTFSVNLKKLENLLGDNFFRIDRKRIVNLNYFISYNKSNGQHFIMLSTEHSFKIASRRVKQLKQTIITQIQS